MQIHLVCIGKVKEPYLRDGIAEYLRRLPPFCTVRVSEYPEQRVRENPGEGEVTRASSAEGEILLRAAGTAGIIVAMDPAGTLMNSGDLAGLIRGWEMEGAGRVTFLIGGPYGLSDEVRSRATILLSLSRLTFTHQMARLILLEQLYRSFTIVRGLPYHR